MRNTITVIRQKDVRGLLNSDFLVSLELKRFLRQ